MKKFLMYILLAISVVSFGLTIYYFSADNEIIYINSSYLVLDVGDEIPTSSLLSYKNKNDQTALSFSASESDVLTYSAGERNFTAVSGGETKIVINTTNRAYSSLVINVLVCDGSADYPFIISNQTDLSNIGVVLKYSTSLNYKLGANIALNDNITGNWTPIVNFSGTLDGNFHTISNIFITDAKIGSLNEAGFFASLTPSAVVKNLFLKDLSVNSSTATYIGAFAGKSEGKIQTSEAVGQLSNSNTNESYVGGVVGFLSKNSQKPLVDRCGFEGKIEIINASNLQISGGIVGYNLKGKVSESYYRAVQGSYVKNKTSYFGGIIGKNEGDSQTAAEVYDNYFYMGSSGTDTNETYLGGIFYSNTGSKNIVLGNYYSGVMTSQHKSTVLSAGAPDENTNKYLSPNDFVLPSNFITAIYPTSNRFWNFDGVWSLGNYYPLLNIRSSVGSTYLIDIDEIITASIITTPQEFYDAISGVTQSTDSVFKVVGTKINGNYVIDFHNFVWGDASHPIPNSFSGTLLSDNGCTIKNLVITNSSRTNNVGLVKELAAASILKGLSFDNVTITGENGKNIGVLAGINKGANIENITIKNVTVEIGGESFGTLFGSSENENTSHGIKSTYVQNVDASANYFTNAGGIVGTNASSITATQSGYSFVKNIKLYSRYVGGVAGYNSGKIEYVYVSDISFNKLRNSSTLMDIYSGSEKGILHSPSLFIGGVAGLNSGEIYAIHAKSNFTAESGYDYNVYMGGIAGESIGIDGSSPLISRAYVFSTFLNVTGNYSSRVGGIVGYQKGRITNCVVDNDTNIITEISSPKATSTNGLVSQLSIEGCSVVGGIVGFDAANTTSFASVFESISKTRLIKGFYAGGIAGVSYGKISRSSVGSRGEDVSRTEVRGFLAGGITALISNGYIKDSFAFCKLITSNNSGSYNGVPSILDYKVSAAGGITVLAINSAIIRGNYCVTTFSGAGVSFAICADTREYSAPSSIIGNIYQTEGSDLPAFGTKLSAADLTGLAGNGFMKFQSGIGSENYGSTWIVSQGKYPDIINLTANAPNTTGLE